MSTEEKIAVMQAFEDGKAIECIPRKGCKWVSINDCIPPEPIWDWESCNYRIKTAPASQLDRIKAEYPGYDVVELGFIQDVLRLNNDSSGKVHIEAQSMKGFYRYVYEIDNLFTVIDPVYKRCNGDGIVYHPVAVLFTK